MSRRRWIVDGYSLLHRDPEFAPLLQGQLQRAREQLVRKVDRMAALHETRATIVFDGRSGLPAAEAATPQVSVVFSPSHQTADTVIERMVHEDRAPAEITVITSDRMERETVTAAGAEAMSCAAFLELGEQASRDLKRAAHHMRQRGLRTTLGDHFPETL